MVGCNEIADISDERGVSGGEAMGYIALAFLRGWLYDIALSGSHIVISHRRVTE
jgi:hypothetical protein